MSGAVPNALALLAALGLGGAVGHWAARPEPRAPAKQRAAPRAPERSAGARVLALLRPLEPGSDLDGWKVRHISGVEQGAIRVGLERGEDRIELSVVLQSDAGPQPPATAGRYAVFYSIQHSATLAEPTGARVAGALAGILAKNSKVQPPAGLSAFRLDSHVR